MTTIIDGNLVRVPDSGASSIKEGEIGTVIALESSYAGPCKRGQGHVNIGSS